MPSDTYNLLKSEIEAVKKADIGWSLQMRQKLIDAYYYKKITYWEFNNLEIKWDKLCKTWQ